MEVYRISKCPFIRDLSGFGAYTYGGRWNSKGYAAVYAAGSRVLALLEALAHIERPRVANFCRVSIYVPDDSIVAYPVFRLPPDWQVQPPPDILKEIGDNFLKAGKVLALKVPSAIAPDEFNFLLNPAHMRFPEVRIIEEATQPIDDRLV